LNLSPNDFRAIRGGIAGIPADVSSDAVGAYAPKLEDIYAPETHAAALDPTTPIVVGSRGTGKSFWSGVLGKKETRVAASKAYPRLGLQNVDVAFGFTGIGGPEGVGVDELTELVPPDATADQAKAFWWATILRAAAQVAGATGVPKVGNFLQMGLRREAREEELLRHEERIRAKGHTLLIVYDALDMVASTWPRRRLLTESLLEVVWAMRAYRAVKLKLFLRPDQVDDDTLRFVELPKLRTGAVRLSWTGTDLYGLLFARLALTGDVVARHAFGRLLRTLGIAEGDQATILARAWPLANSSDEQGRVMDIVAGPYMASGPYGFKKGKTYGWPLTHLADAFDEVTPRSFVGLMIAASKYGPAPDDRVITPDGIRHGLRAASRTRVDQLHTEFPWIKGVLAPLDGLLLPQNEKQVFRVWQRARTIATLIADARASNYLPPFPIEDQQSESQLFEALGRIGVMFRRRDGRIDMPDLFRVAAKLLKKGGTAPV
jgi:hypothetical protein